MRRRSTTFTRWARWLATFIGFPAAGVTARLVAGDIDSFGAAAVGGLAAGAVLGAVQAVVGGLAPGSRLRWTAATAAGLAVGLAAGASVVDFRTDTAALVVMGAVCGAALGIAQAIAVPLAGRDRIAWIVATPAAWAAGWLITSQVIVDVDRHHAIFGSSGALVASALTGLLVVHWRSTGAGSPAPVVRFSDRAGVS